MRTSHAPILILLAVAGPLAAGADCTATSGEGLRPVVELFTSEGCSSCPPADRWLSTLRSNALAPGQFTALAYHVDYWDYIGWKDRFAAPAHGERHRRMVAQGGGRVRYTPQVFVNGHEYAAWRDNEVPIASPPVRVQLEARTQGESRYRWRVFVTGDRAPSGPLSLSIALTEDGLGSRVTAGENRGEELRHDFVVREIADFVLEGPRFAFSAPLSLPADADPRRARASVILRAPGGQLVQSLSVALCQ